MIAFRLLDMESGERYTFTSRASVKGWLPGKIEVTTWIKLPESLKPGLYELAVAVVDPATEKSAIRLAIAGRDKEGWYPLSQIEVRENT